MKVKGKKTGATVDNNHRSSDNGLSIDESKQEVKYFNDTQKMCQLQECNPHKFPH